MIYLDVILRTIVVYLFIVLAIRIFGKREITQLSVIDLVFILLISNSVQNAMIGPNTSLDTGIVAAISLFIINRLLGILINKSSKVTKFLEGDPIMLIYHGKVIPAHLDKADITLDELEASVREHGVEQVSKVDLAVLERDGNISVLSHNFQHHTTRKRRAHKVLEKTE